MRYLALLLTFLLLPTVALAEGEITGPWWVPVVQAVATSLLGVLSVVLIALATRGLRALDRKLGWDTERTGAAIASRLVLEAEQTLRRSIAEDLADGKISAEEARARLEKLAKGLAAQVAADIGVGETVARSMVEAAVAATGASSALTRSPVDPT